MIRCWTTLPCDASLGPRSAGSWGAHRASFAVCLALLVIAALQTPPSGAAQGGRGLLPTSAAHQQVVQELVALAIVAAQVRFRQARRQPLRRARQVHHLSSGIWFLFLYTSTLFHVGGTFALTGPLVAARFPIVVATQLARWNRRAWSLCNAVADQCCCLISARLGHTSSGSGSSDHGTRRQAQVQERSWASFK